MDDLKSQFLLDPAVVFLNHGSFGATPREVFDVYQEWQRRLERQPVQFVVNELFDHLADSRQVLGKYLNVEANDIVYIPNVTFGVNVVARSLKLGPGDEVLSTDHEYGACVNAWRYLSERRGFLYRQCQIPMPPPTDEDLVDLFWQNVTSQTKVIYLSHLTSPTAISLPVEEICKRAAVNDIISIIDGAHAPGQVDLDLAAIGADFYIGNCHKWLSAPKGSAFLYAERSKQQLIEPLIIGWGWGEDRELTFGSDFLDYLQWLGTRDLAAYLAVPAAISFMEAHNWTVVRQQCHELVRQAIKGINDLTGQPSLYDSHEDFYQMAVAALPHVEDVRTSKADFYKRFQVEIPFIKWNDQQFIRVSVQGYNTPADIERLLQSLKEFFNL